MSKYRALGAFVGLSSQSLFKSCTFGFSNKFEGVFDYQLSRIWHEPMILSPGNKYFLCSCC
jgi:hypothetical protein